MFISLNKTFFLCLDEKIMDLEIMTKLANARGALGKLDGIVRTLPNPEMLVNTITLREAKDSSEIENIFTSHDELYQALAVETTLVLFLSNESI